MSNKQIVGFVGKPFKDFITWLQEHEYEVHLYYDKRDSYDPQGADTVYKLDFSSQEALEADLKQVPQKPDFVVCTFENAVPMKTKIAMALGLPGPTEKAAYIATDKFEMRKAFQQHCPDFSPQFALVTKWEEVEAFLRNSKIEFPLILKPTNLFKSLLVTKNNSVEELRKNFDESLSLIHKIYEKENVKYEPRFVLEEYLDGQSYSIEVFTDRDGNAVPAPSPVDLIMGRDIGVNDNYNYSRKVPSKLSDYEQRQVKDAALAGVKAMGLTSSPAHVEIVYTKNGPRLIEIGARSGGYRPRMHWLAQGVDIFQANVDVAQGKLPTLQATKNLHCAVYEVFAEDEGLFKEVTNFEKSRFPTLYYSNQKAVPGVMTGPSKKGYRFALVALFLSEDEKQFTEDTTYFEENVKVVLQ